MNLDDTVSSSVESAVRAEPVDGVLLLQRVNAAGTRRSGRRWWSAAAVVTSAAAVLAVALVAPSLLGNGASQQLATEPTEVPPGQRAVSWHGVQVFVPAGWKLYDLRCHEPQSSTVVVPGFRNDCGSSYVPGLTVVEFHAGSDPAPGSRSVEVSGQRGHRGTEPLEEEPGVRAVLALPDLDVTVSVRSTEEAIAQAMLDTVQVVDEDVNGCLTRLAGTAPPEPDVPGAAERVIPGTPTRVSLCEYGDLRLEHSGTLNPQEVQALQEVLDAAPEGTSPSRSGSSVSPDLCPEYDRAPMVIQAEYADGSRLQVFTRLNSCTGPDPDNGARRVVLPANSEALFTLYSAVRR